MENVHTNSAFFYDVLSMLFSTFKQPVLKKEIDKQMDMQDP